MTDMELLHIHFDTGEEHFLPVNDFIKSSKSVSIIIDDINKQIFGGGIKYELVMLPPEDGSFLKKIGIMAMISAAYVAEPIVKDYALGGFEGITNHQPSFYGKNHFRALRDLTEGFFQTEVVQLEKYISNPLNLDKSFKAKSDFYKMCAANKQISGLGFDDTINFPIKKNRFAFHTSKDRIREMDSDFIIFDDAIIISPVNVDKNIKWELLDKTTGAKILAFMHDEEFKNGLLSGKYPQKRTSYDDRVKILVEYKKHIKNGNVETKDVCINEVYKFNGETIKSVPENLLEGTRFQAPKESPMDKLWRYGT